MFRKLQNLDEIRHTLFFLKTGLFPPDLFWKENGFCTRKLVVAPDGHGFLPSTVIKKLLGGLE